MSHDHFPRALSRAEISAFASAQSSLMKSGKLYNSDGSAIEDTSFELAFEKLLKHNRDYKLMFFCYKEDYEEVEESLRKYETQRYPISIYRFQVDPKTKAIEKDMQGYTLYQSEDNYPTTLQRRERMSGGRLSRGQLSRAELAEFAYAYCRLQADGKLCNYLGLITRDFRSSMATSDDNPCEHLGDMKGELTCFEGTFEEILRPEINRGYTNDHNIIFCYREHYPEVEYSLRKYEREHLRIRIFMIDIDPRTRQLSRDKEGYIIYLSRDYPDEEYPWKTSLKGLRQCRAPDPYCIKNPPTHTSRTSSAVSSPEE